MIKTGKIPNSVNPSATQKERSYSEIQIMKKLKFFTFVLAFLASVTASAQTNNPTFATNFVVGKQFIWERVTEVGTTSVTVRVIDEVAPPATASTNPPPAAKAKVGKNDPPPVFIARPETNNSPQVYYYGQYATNRYGDGPGEVKRYAPGEIQWSGSAQPSGGTQNYAVDQRPLDQGVQPAPVAHYATHQGTYATAPATYATHGAYPVYAEPGSYFPVAHYQTYGYSYPTYGYGAHYGYGYVDRRSLFGIQFDAVVVPSYNHAPGWSVRRGGVTHYPTHQRNYSTHHSGGDGHHRGGRR